MSVFACKQVLSPFLARALAFDRMVSLGAFRARLNVLPCVGVPLNAPCACRACRSSDARATPLRTAAEPSDRLRRWCKWLHSVASCRSIIFPSEFAAVAQLPLFWARCTFH